MRGSDVSRPLVAASTRSADISGSEAIARLDRQQHVVGERLLARPLNTLCAQSGHAVHSEARSEADLSTRPCSSSRELAAGLRQAASIAGAFSLKDASCAASAGWKAGLASARAT